MNSRVTSTLGRETWCFFSGNVAPGVAEVGLDMVFELSILWEGFTDSLIHFP